MEIIIKDKKIELRYTVRSMFIFEKLANKVFQPTTLTDLYLFFYSVILANDPDIDLTFSEFIEICDNDFSLFNQFNDWLNKEFLKQNQFVDGNNDDDSKKK